MDLFSKQVYLLRMKWESTTQPGSFWNPVENPRIRTRYEGRNDKTIMKTALIRCRMDMTSSDSRRDLVLQLDRIPSTADNQICHIAPVSHIAEHGRNESALLCLAYAV